MYNLNENDRAFSRLDNPVFFRMGYFDQVKLNKANFMDKEFQIETWFKFDILLDWYKKEVAIFMDGTFIQTTPFFSLDRDTMLDCNGEGEDAELKNKWAFVNTLMLYNLTPGTRTAFRDIRLCTDLCQGT